MVLNVRTRIAIVITVIVALNVAAAAFSWGLYASAARAAAEARVAADRARLVAEASVRITEFTAGANDLGYSVSRATASEERSRLYGALIGTYPVVDKAVQRVVDAAPGSSGTAVSEGWSQLKEQTFAWINAEAKDGGANFRITREPNGVYRDSVDSSLTLPADLAALPAVAVRQTLRDRAEHLKYATLGDVAKQATAEAAAAGDAELGARQLAQQGTLALIALSALVAMLLGVWLYRGISRPLTRAKDYADRVAHGDFSATLDGHSPDEIGVLTHAVEDMKDRLVREMNGMREMAGAVLYTAEEVREAVDAVDDKVDEAAGGASDVKAGLLEVSSRVDALQDLSRQMLGSS